MKTIDRLSKRAALFVSILAMVLLLVPLVCMPFVSTDESAELQELAEFPCLVAEDGNLNLSFLSELGDYFSDHFAFRQELISLDAKLKMAVGESATDQVVVGTNDWLYYGATLADYQQSDTMSDRAAKNAAYNLALTQEYVESLGAQLIVTIAPNKNTIYPENMPYYYLSGDSEGNLDKLKRALEDAGVNYFDARGLLEEEIAENPDGEALYFKMDTHWTTRGALLVYNGIMDVLGLDHESYRNAALSVNEGNVGDLEEMLTPLWRRTEASSFYEAANDYSYINDAETVEDSFIVTQANAAGTSSSASSASKSASDAERNPDSSTLVMFRDSFGNALLPFFASEFAMAVFSKLVPYDMSIVESYEADCAVIERAERHLGFFATTPPAIPAPERELLSVGETVEAASVSVTENGSYLQIEGTIDERYLPEDSQVYVCVTDAEGVQKCYEAFLRSVADGASKSETGEASQVSNNAGASVTNDCGYLAYLPLDELPVGVACLSVMSVYNGHATVVGSYALSD